MKFWQKKKTFDISETDQVYKVIYLGNVVTSWAKGEHTLEKPLTALWRNYCNNYANYHIKNGDTKKQRQPQNKQILMKLTICNQGLKALTREFGLTEYWANRICFCGQNTNFPRVFAWIYRHEAKQKKQELRVHACFVNSQSNVNKMITTLQQKVNFALNEFKREKRLKENARRILSMNESLNLDDEIEHDKTDSEIFNEFVDRLYIKMNGQPNGKQLKDDLSINSSERMNYESANTSKNSTLDSKRITRNPSQGSLNSIKSKSSTSSKKSVNYDSNLMPVRRQFLVKGLKNFKEPIERSKSAPKLSSISEEFPSSEEDEEENYDYTLNKNNFVGLDYFNIIDEPDDEEIIRELGLISELTGHDEMNEDEILNENDKTLTEFNENDLNDHYNSTKYSFNDQEFKKISPTIYEDTKEELNNLNHNLYNHLMNDQSKSVSNTDTSSSNENIEYSSGNDELKQDNLTSSDETDLATKIENTLNKNNQQNIQINNQSNDLQLVNNQPNGEIKNETTKLFKNQSNDLFNSCQSPQFIIFKRTSSFNNRECDLHAKQIVENCKLIQDLVLNF